MYIDYFYFTTYYTTYLFFIVLNEYEYECIKYIKCVKVIYKCQMTHINYLLVLSVVALRCFHKYFSTHVYYSATCKYKDNVFKYILSIKSKCVLVGLRRPVRLVRQRIHFR